MKIITHIITFIIGVTAAVLVVSFTNKPLFVNNNPNDRLLKLKHYSIAELKQAVEQIEQDSIVSFVNIQSKLNKNSIPFFESASASITISNNASVAVAQDVKVKIYLISQTNSVIDSLEHVIYEKIPPGKSKLIQKEIEYNKYLSTLNCKLLEVKTE